MPVLALHLQCPELSRRDPLATAYGPASPAARPWAAVPSVVPATANPSPGRRHNCHRLLLPRQYLAPTPGLGHSTWAAWLEDARDWPGTCRPAPHFPEGPVAWPGMGSQSQEGELESLTGRGGGTAGETVAPSLQSGGPWWVPAAFPLPLPFSSTQAPKSSSPCSPLPQSQASLSQPQASPGIPRLFHWGSHDSGVWLGTVGIRFCGGVRCCMCSCKNVHDHICDHDCLG